MITEINELKTLKGIYHTNINVTLMVESVIRIKSGITINAAVSVKASFNKSQITTFARYF